MTEDLEQQAMRIAIDQGKRSVSEAGRQSPRVGACIVKDGQILEYSFRGEFAPGDHAEYTLFEKKLAGEELSDCILFTTLEPCTIRSASKTPCAKRIVDRGIKHVFIGMLDPDPRIRNKGQISLRAAGVEVDYFPSELREEIQGDNRAFTDHFLMNSELFGIVRFDYEKVGGTDGTFTFGRGDMRFFTSWSRRGADSIYIQRSGFRMLALAEGYHNIADITDGSVFPGGSSSQHPHINQIVVLQNQQGYWAALKILQIRNRERNADHDEVTVEYRILGDGSANFKRGS